MRAPYARAADPISHTNPTGARSERKEPIVCALYARAVDLIGLSNPICRVSERKEPAEDADRVRAERARLLREATEQRAMPHIHIDVKEADQVRHDWILAQPINAAPSQERTQGLTRACS